MHAMDDGTSVQREKKNGVRSDEKKASRRTLDYHNGNPRARNCD